MSSSIAMPVIWILGGVAAVAVLGVVALVLGATAMRPHHKRPPGPPAAPPGAP